MSPSYLFIVFIALCAFTHVLGDLYMQNPRGSNDRLNEAGDRQNANRLFDSQNNARGGYCYGPELSYVEGSELSIEWTAQHACGNGNTDCALIAQYMCSDENGPAEQVIRDGTTTNSIQTGTTPTAGNYYNQKDAATGKYTYGMNENILYYQNSVARSRNKGLYTATQAVANNKGALATRQNAAGTLSGLEAAEERDYYPYWHPSPWKDIAVLVNEDSKINCATYQAESQNVKGKNYCKVANVAAVGAGQLANNEADCIKQKGTWTVEPAFGIPAPECLAAPVSRDNHLGNGVDGQTLSYNWTLPRAAQEACITGGKCACALRLRYNITLGEVDAAFDAGDNAAVKQDPLVKTVDNVNVQLAIDTAQVSRTFQDRSFMFRIVSRESVGAAQDTKIYNLNVRGKRGNIVQTYPATEYDFVPTALEVTKDDAVHIQWTGCDTNPANNAGEGTAQTDRSNIVQIASAKNNTPAGADIPQLFQDPAKRASFASLDQTGCKNAADLAKQAAAGGPAVDQNKANCALLNAAGPRYNGGLVTFADHPEGDYYYMSTRNNNFSNRSQKASIKVKGIKPLAAWKTAVIVVAAVVASAIGALVGTVVYAKRNPHSRAADVVSKIPGLNKI